MSVVFGCIDVETVGTVGVGVVVGVAGDLVVDEGGGVAAEVGHADGGHDCCGRGLGGLVAAAGRA